MRAGKESSLNPTRQREKAFVKAYIPLMLKEGGAADAAKAAGYEGSRNTLSKIGYQILNRPRVKRSIKRIIDMGEKKIAEKESTLDVIKELAILGGSDISKVSELFTVGVPEMNADGTVIEDPSYGKRRAKMVKDLREILKKMGPESRTIKKIRMGVDGVEFDLHDKVRPLELLGDHEQMFVKKDGDDDDTPEGSSVVFLPKNGFEVTIRSKRAKK